MSCCPTGPEARARAGRHLRERGVVELVQQPPAGRVRRDRPEQSLLIAQYRYLGDGGRAVGDRDPTCETTPAPSAVTMIFGRLVVACTRKVPPRPRRTWSSASPVLPGHEALSAFGVTFAAARS
jgi:hypothetical protein